MARRRATTPRSTPRSRACARSRRPTENLVPATIELARAGGTVGEWAGALRDVFGEYRAPTGVGAVVGPARRRACRRCATRVHGVAADGRPDPAPRRQARPRRPLERRRADRGRRPRRRHGGRLPGHPAHARPQIAAAARDEDVDVVGLSILSGSHLALVPETLRAAARGRGRRAGRGRRHHPRRRPRRSWRPGRGPRLHAEGLPTRGDHGGDRRPRPCSSERLTWRQCSGRGGHPPMRHRMQDPRLVVAVSAGIAALAPDA